MGLNPLTMLMYAKSNDNKTKQKCYDIIDKALMYAKSNDNKTKQKCYDIIDKALRIHFSVDFKMIFNCI